MTVVVSGEYPKIASQLRALGLKVVTTEANSYVSEKVAFHPDMQLLPLPQKTFVLKGSGSLAEKLDKNVAFTELPDKLYPKDVLCNGKLVGHTLFCNTKTIDKSIVAYCEANAVEVLNVNQGYTGCSICAVDDNSIITSDRSVAVTAEKNHFDVLLISEGFIELPGYGYGFIGGCSGKINGELFFSGSLKRHPDCQRILRFADSKGVKTKELPNDKLTDIGGIVSIF